MFTGVDSEHIEAVWPFVEGHIARICQKNRGKFDSDDVKEMLKDRRMQLWVYAPKDLELLCLTEIMNYPKCRVCRVCGVAGKKSEQWRGFLKIVEEWAKSEGCTKIETLAGKGWAKMLSDYDITHYFFEKELINA